ncbi:MAG: carboxyvinyl-carboxyphosphonate phosphorylmutase [Desulfobacteraceae bacterium]|nr:MAG: carboxyvinyl-carboxyphosphonate phosphorylmutase [Desulfobacteraceae bacterium]
MAESTSLKKRLQAGEFMVLPGVFDALTARIVQGVGFKAAYMTGFGVAASHGYPDFGLLTMSDMLAVLTRICNAVDIPIIADADTGYGNPVNVYHTVKQYEKAGAQGIQLEDQTWPKRCGHMAGKQVIEAEEMVDKIAAAVDARENEETLLVIRTDAIATHGFEEAIRRAELYADAGADVLFVEAPDPEQMVRIPSLLAKPCLLNAAMPDPNMTAGRIKEMGYALAIFPGVTLLGVVEGAYQLSRLLNEEGRFALAKGMRFNFDEFNHLMNIDTYMRLDKKFSNHQ